MEDDEYEYQYDANETSTFLVELDLSTLNGIKRDAPKRRYAKRQRKDDIVLDEAEEPDDGNAEDEADLDQPLLAAPGAQATSSKDSLQILEGDSINPIVAYKGKFYSCTWHDMIGTNMFYSLPQQGVGTTRDYDLLGTSRVKLVGQRAKVTEKASSRKKQRVGHETNSPVPGSAVDSAATERQEQIDFLAKLKAIQESRQTTSNGASLVDHQDPPDARDRESDQSG
jgi:hypothetical protein